MKETKKISLEEYESKYNKKVNIKRARLLLVILLGLIAVLLIYFLLQLVLKLFEINDIAGYVGIAVSSLAFIFIYVVPLIMIFKKKTFITRVNKYNVKSAKRRNRLLRKELANKIIEFADDTDNIGWYNEGRLEILRDALKSKNDDSIKTALNDIYSKDINKTANQIIATTAVKVGVFTAISQSDKIDTAVVSLFELELIRQLVFLHGFRPNEEELLKIYAGVLRNAFISYGLGSLKFTDISVLGKAAESIPVLGSVIATVIGSASQGIVNGALTVVIGYQIKSILRKDYHLQDILEDVIFNDENQEEMIKETKATISDKLKGYKKA